MFYIIICLAADEGDTSLATEYPSDTYFFNMVRHGKLYLTRLKNVRKATAMRRRHRPAFAKERSPASPRHSPPRLTRNSAWIFLPNGPFYNAKLSSKRVAYSPPHLENIKSLWCSRPHANGRPTYITGVVQWLLCHGRGTKISKISFLSHFTSVNRNCCYSTEFFERGIVGKSEQGYNFFLK